MSISKKVLLVEDNPADARLVQEMLKEQSSNQIEITHAKELNIALNYLGKTDFDVILLDLNLPDSTGLNTIVEVQKASGVIPIIVVSVMTDETDILEALRKGAHDYLVKGQIDYYQIFRAIRNAIERRNKNEELLRSLKQFETLFNSTNDAIFISSFDGRFLQVNEVAVRTLGRTKEELLQMDFIDITVPEAKERIPKLLNAVIEKRKLIFEITQVAKDGKVLPTEISSRVIDFHGKPAILSVVRDITERKRVEELSGQRAKDEINGFLASALPVFASNFPPQVRDIFAINFGNRFDDIMRPRYQRALGDGQATAEGCGTCGGSSPMYNDQLEWIAKLFSNLGIPVEKGLSENNTFLDLLDCPWASVINGNPVFCLLCRTMVTRSAKWVDPNANASQMTSIAGGAKRCHFVMSTSPSELKVP
jgi:PAS domain S-box-containing protein